MDAAAHDHDAASSRPGGAGLAPIWQRGVVEIKIGIQHVNREVVVDTTTASDEIVAAVHAALTDGTALTIDGERGRKVIVPAGSIGYVDVGEETPRKVGFGAG